MFHDTLRPSDKAGWFAAAYFVLSLLQAQLQAFWHWVESPLPVGAVATTDCITFLMQLKQRNPSLGKMNLGWTYGLISSVMQQGEIKLQRDLAFFSKRRNFDVFCKLLGVESVIWLMKG